MTNDLLFLIRLPYCSLLSLVPSTYIFLGFPIRLKTLDLRYTNNHSHSNDKTDKITDISDIFLNLTPSDFFNGDLEHNLEVSDDDQADDSSNEEDTPFEDEVQRYTDRTLNMHSIVRLTD
jgi:hypothetical protein